MKKHLLSGAAAVSFIVASGVGYAADLPVKAAPPVYGCIWDGFYAGAHIGIGAPRFKGTFVGDSDPTGLKQNPVGFLGGGQIGQNWCNNTFVTGWEGDVSFLSASKTHLHDSDDDFIKNRMSLLASLRLRMGTTIDPQTMLYLAFGPAYAHGTATFFDEDGPTTLKSNFDKFGGVIAFGVEKWLQGNWFGRVEAAYYLFDGRINFDDGTHSASDKLGGIFALQMGLSYKFGNMGKTPAPMPTKAPAYYNWSGFYVGGNAGWQGSRIGLSDPTNVATTVTFEPNHNSFALGGHLGAQTQFDRFVLGIEGSYVSGFDREEFRTPSFGPVFQPGGTGTTATWLKDTWSIGGRAGYSMGIWMPYLTAGWAQGRFGFEVLDHQQTASNKTSGAYYGGGIDYALAHNWVLGLEYRYYDFKAKFSTASDGEPIRFDPTTQTIMARLSYKFGTN
jgi:opacity protein-like surface antigen